MLSLQLYEISGRRDLNINLDLYDKSYIHWRNVWSDEFSRSTFFCSDYYTNVQNIFLICHKDRIAAQAAFNFYNLSYDSDRDSKYIQIYKNIGFIEKCKREDVLVSVEFVSRDPVYSIKNVGLSLATVLIGLIQKEFYYSEASYALGTASIIKGVDKLAASFGYYSVGRVDSYGIDCSVLVNSRETLKQHEELKYVEAIDSLWQKKINLKKATEGERYGRIKAAV